MNERTHESQDVKIYFYLRFV